MILCMYWDMGSSFATVYGLNYIAFYLNYLYCSLKCNTVKLLLVITVVRYALSYATIKSECGVYGMLCTLLRWLCIFYYNCCRYIIFSCRICKWLKHKDTSSQIPWNCFRNLEYIYMYKPAKMLHQLASKLNHTTDALCLYYSQ